MIIEDGLACCEYRPLAPSPTACRKTFKFVAEYDSVVVWAVLAGVYLEKRSMKRADVFMCIGIACVVLMALNASVGGADSGIVVASEDAESAPREAVRNFSGGGVWQDRASSAKRPWRVHLLRDAEGAIRAKLSVPGVAKLDGAHVEAQVIGREAFGVLLDEKGAQIDTFNATLQAAGAGGSFIMGDGQTGQWEYDARTKAEVVRLEGGEDVAAPADAPE